MIKKIYLRRKLNYVMIRKIIAMMSISILVGVNNGIIYASTILNENIYLSKNVSSSEMVYDTYIITEDIMKEYEELLDMYYKNGIIIDISIEEFAGLYERNELRKILNYAVEDKLYENNIPYNSAHAVTATLSSSSSSTSGYYYNTGKERPSECNYSKYDLLDVVRRGDIIYESEGGYGITGHTLIVEGKFYDATSKKYYIRVIEAIKSGVVRSVLDDTRIDEKGGQIYRPSQPGYSSCKAAVEFAISQLEKKYYLDVPAKDTGKNELDWYCSELVWASYKSAGYDIEQPAFFDEPGVTPRDIATSKVCYWVSCYK